MVRKRTRRRQIAVVVALIVVPSALTLLVLRGRQHGAKANAQRNADVISCGKAIDVAGDAVVQAWSSAATRGVQTANRAAANAMIRECAKLYSREPCRHASEAMTEDNRVLPSDKMRRLVEACRDAYCPEMTERPALCSAGDLSLVAPASAVPMWEELDEAILRHELGPTASHVLEARARAKRRTAAAMDYYVDAGSPSYRIEPAK